MTREEIAENVAFVRGLAEEGRHAPLIGGGFLVLFGVLLAIAYVVQWMLLTGVLDVMHGLAFGYLWGGFSVLAVAGGWAMRARLSRMPGGGTLGNRVDRAVWRSASAALLAVVVGSLIRASMNHDPTAPNVIMAAGFGLYAVALGVTAKMSEQNWLGVFAALSAVVSLALWAVIDEPWAYLIAAGGSLLVLLAPGLVLMQREPKAA